MSSDLPKQRKEPWFKKISEGVLFGLGGLPAAIDPRARDTLTMPNALPEVLAKSASSVTVDNYAAAEATRGRK